MKFIHFYNDFLNERDQLNKFHKQVPFDKTIEMLFTL